MAFHHKTGSNISSQISVSAPSLRADRIGRIKFREHKRRMEEDPAFRQKMQRIALINGDRGQIAKGNRKVVITLPKFSWDKE